VAELEAKERADDLNIRKVNMLFRSEEITESGKIENDCYV
jgi:hypothetical protein